MSKRSINILFLFGDIFAIGAAIFGYQVIDTMWDIIRQHPEQITYTNADGYLFMGILFPSIHLLIIPWFKQFEKIIIYTFAISGLIGLLVVPRVIDYYIRTQLVEDGYTYCGSERNGNIRYSNRIWMLDVSCGEKLFEQNGNSKKKNMP